MEEVINDFLSYLKNVKKVSVNTYDSYSRDIVSFMDFLEDRKINDVNDITENIILLYKMHLEELGRSGLTISRHLATLRKFFYYLFSNRIIEHNPIDEIATPRVKKKSVELLSYNEINNLLKVVDEDLKDEFRDIAILKLIYYSDIKVSELVNTNIDDFNLQIGYLRCKNNRKQDRIMPLNKELLECISNYITYDRNELAAQDEQALFVNKLGKRMSRQAFWKIINKYAKSAGIVKPVTFSMLRNSFIVYNIKKGLNIDEVEQILEYGKNHI